MPSKKQSIKMQITISDKDTMWYPRAVHKTVTDLGWTCRKKSQLYIENGGLCWIIGIQNNNFTFRNKQWKFNEEEQSPIYQPNPWRHTVAAIDDHFYHYDVPKRHVSKYPITCLLGKHEEGKYMMRGKRCIRSNQNTKMKGGNSVVILKIWD